MFGLRLTSASSASLLLNLEGVLTALLAWFVFKENFDRRIFVGMIAILGGRGFAFLATTERAWCSLGCAGYFRGMLVLGNR